MKDIGIRRLGSGRVHRARVPNEVLYEAVVFGCPVVAVDGPIVARCGAKLRGNLIVIPEEILRQESQRPSQCNHCLDVIRHDYRKAEDVAA